MNSNDTEDPERSQRRKLEEIREGLEEVAAALAWRRGLLDQEPSIARHAPPIDPGPWGSHPGR